MDPAIEEHGGSIVQTGGDSLLIVFDSIDGAVRCAVKVQQQVWAERFHVDIGVIAEAFDEITGRLVHSFAVKLIEDVNRRIEAIDPQNWIPDDLVMRGRGLLSKPHSAANRHEALKCFEQAFDGDPRSVDAKYGIASVLMSNVLDGWTLAPEQDKARAEKLLTEILRDDAINSDAHANMGMLRRAQGRLNDARIELDMAIALAPNHIQAIGQLGITLTFLGHPEAAVPLIERCLRLAPHDRNTPVNQAILGLCKLLLGDAEEAVVWLRKARAANPRLFYIHAFLAAALALRNELDEAGYALRQAVQVRPEFGSNSDVEDLLRETPLNTSPFGGRLSTPALFGRVCLWSSPISLPCRTNSAMAPWRDRQ